MWLELPGNGSRFLLSLGQSAEHRAPASFSPPHHRTSSFYKVLHREGNPLSAPPGPALRAPQLRRSGGSARSAARPSTQPQQQQQRTTTTGTSSPPLYPIQPTAATATTAATAAVPATAPGGRLHPRWLTTRGHPCWPPGPVQPPPAAASTAPPRLHPRWFTTRGHPCWHPRQLCAGPHAGIAQAVVLRPSLRPRCTAPLAHANHLIRPPAPAPARHARHALAPSLQPLQSTPRLTSPLRLAALHSLPSSRQSLHYFRQQPHRQHQRRPTARQAFIIPTLIVYGNNRDYRKSITATAATLPIRRERSALLERPGWRAEPCMSRSL